LTWLNPDRNAFRAIFSYRCNTAELVSLKPDSNELRQTMSCCGSDYGAWIIHRTTKRSARPYGSPARATHKFGSFFRPRRKGFTKPSELYLRSKSEKLCQAPSR